MKKFFIILILLFFTACFENIQTNNTVVDFHTHFSLDASVTQLIFDGQRVRDVAPPIVEYRGGLPRVYLRADFLRDYIDPFVFWDEFAGVLFFSTLEEMLEFSPDSDYFLVNGSPRPAESSIIERDGAIFVPVSIIHGLYPLIVEYQPAHNFVVVTTATEPQTTATAATNRTLVRYWPSERAPIAAVCGQGTQLVLFPDFEEEEHEPDDAFIRVRTPHGLLGYVHSSDIEDSTTATPLDDLRRNTILESFIDNSVYPSKIFQGAGAVNLIWESANNHDANIYNMQTPLHSSLTAISPTWFRINSEGTELNSVASREYVDWAQAQGVEVWALVFDVDHTRVRAFLQNRDARQQAVNQLIEYVETLNLDGLNIDFEHLRFSNEGAYKIQFLRELAIPMRARGITLSAAVKVPQPETAFYRRDLIAKTVDFVMVMAYDEFWPSAPETGHGHGPNASLPFVQRAVDNTLREVPPDRLILGVPFYNRVWRTNRRTDEVTHHAAWGTNTTRAFFEDRNVSWLWDAEKGAYYGEVADFDDGTTVIYQVWLEDARSLQEKLHIYHDNNLAGVASWSRLFSIAEFWEVLENYF